MHQENSHQLCYAIYSNLGLGLSKDKQMHLENAHMNFYTWNVGDHTA